MLLASCNRELTTNISNNNGIIMSHDKRCVGERWPPGLFIQPFSLQSWRTWVLLIHLLCHLQHIYSIALFVVARWPWQPRASHSYTRALNLKKRLHFLSRMPFPAASVTRTPTEELGMVRLLWAQEKLNPGARAGLSQKRRRVDLGRQSPLWGSLLPGGLCSLEENMGVCFYKGGEGRKRLQ